MVFTLYNLLRNSLRVDFSILVSKLNLHSSSDDSLLRELMKDRLSRRFIIDILDDQGGVIGETIILFRFQ